MRVSLLLVLALAAIPVPAHAVRELSGTTPGGAAFRIAVPDAWRAGDPLVLVQHGYQLGRVTEPSFGPLADRMLADGYALAASGYRTRGWGLFTAADDNAELVERFAATYGAPGPLYAVGGSMGGLAAMKLAEDPRFVDRIAGVYTLCAPLAGSRVWDQALDVRLAYDAVCAGDIEEQEFPRGSEPYPWALDLDDIPDQTPDIDDVDEVVRALAPAALCLGLGVPQEQRLGIQNTRMDLVRRITGAADEDALSVLLAYATFGLADVLRSPDKMAGANPFDTRGVELGDVGRFFDIPTIVPQPLAVARFARVSSLAGGARARVLALHNLRDTLVSSAHIRALPASAAGAPAARAFLTDDGRAMHCAFGDGEAIAGWDALTAWVGGGSAPTAASLAARCVAAGGSAPACRFTDTSAAPSLNSVMTPRPRKVAAEASVRQAGLVFDPARAGEGWFLEPQPDGRLLITGYTYPPAGVGGDQQWLFGEGRIVGTGVATDYVIRTEGARFGAAFDPADVVRVPWGRIELGFDDTNSLQLRYEGPAAFGSSERTLTRLTRFQTPTATQLPLPGAWQLSGALVPAGRSGEGVFFHAVIDSPARVAPERLFLLWFTYDPLGRPAWLFGEGRARVAGTSFPTAFRFDLLRPVGTRFGSAFDPAAVQLAPWGTADVDFSSCDAARLTWASTQAGYGGGTLPLERLTRPAGSACFALPYALPSGQSVY